MTLLDRFRAAPRHKHPDPAVRLAFVAEIPLDDRETIATMARDDEDPRVRRAAVGKLMDPALLGGIARQDPDEGVRAHAGAMLRDLALDVFEGVGEAEALDAVDALGDPRTLTLIARTAAREIVALRALSRLTEAHSWGTLARHSQTEAVRRAALAQLQARHEHGEILSVAMNGEYKDAALAGVELITDSGQLEQIAMRGKNKAAAKRARAMLRAEEERVTAQNAAAASAAAASAAAAAASAAPSTPVPVSPPPVLDSAGAEVESADAEERRAAEESARMVREAELAREADAVREREAQAAELRLARLSELADRALVAADQPDLAEARRQFAATRREWSSASAGGVVDESVAARFAVAETKFAARDSEARETDARARREALSRLQHLLGRVESLPARADLTLKAAERALRDVRTALGAMPPLPGREEAEAITKRLRDAQTALTPKLQELRDADDWQRWANAGVQEQLCVKMEALQQLEDPDAIAREVRELQDQWRKAADVPRAQADALWRRFKTAHDIVWPRCEAHFAAEAQARAGNLAKRVELCEKAESLADSSHWIQTAEEIKRLQAEWKTIGPVPRGREKAVWERFRAACDRFFTRRHDDLVNRKALWAENLAKKIALCEKAEAVALSVDWESTAAELKRLQAEWKTIGPVKKTRSEAIWQRFRAACDAFFSRYAQRHELAREERVAAREAICAELEGLNAAEPDAAAPEDLLGRIRSLRARWQQELAARGVDPDRARAFDDRFAAAHAQVLARWPAVFAGTDLDPDANRKRLEALATRMEDLARSLAGPLDAADASLSPTVRLAAMLKEQLAANTIGGKVEDDSRLRAAAEEVRQAQSQWSRVGPVAEAVRRPLADRFQRACRQIMDKAGAASAAAGSSGTGRPGGSMSAGRPGGSGGTGRSSEFGGGRPGAGGKERR